MFVATCEFDILLGDVHSLKEKRAVLRPIVKEVQRRFAVAVAETEHQDLHRRSIVTVAAVSGTAAHAPEITVVAVRRRLFGGDDEGVR